MEDDGRVEVVFERGGDGYALMLKTLCNGLLYRVGPARDPQQPRFWCVMVYRCSSGVLADPSERPWFGQGGHRREELQALMQAIREDPGAWLASADNRELRDWMTAPRLESAAVKAPTHPRAAREPVA